MSSWGQWPTADFELVISTARLTLTLVDASSASDIKHLLACFNSTIAHRDMGDFGLRAPEEMNELLHSLYLLPQHSHGVDFGRRPAFWIIREGPQNPTGTRVGYVAITSEPETPDLDPHMGWNVLPEFIGNGYATEATLKMRDYWTDVVGVCPIRATIKPTNEKSIAVAQRVGMERGEGLNEAGKVVMWWRGKRGATHDSYVGCKKAEV